MIGRGVAYRKTEETDLLRSKRGSCSLGGVWRTAKQDSTGYCSSPPSTSSSLHRLPLTSSSLHGLLFIQPPPRATPPSTVQPPLHEHPSTFYCSSSPPPQHGVLFIQRQRHRSLFIHPPQCSLFIQRGGIHRLQLAAVAKESLDRVQLTAIDRSLGFSNA